MSCLGGRILSSPAASALNPDSSLQPPLVRNLKRGGRDAGAGGGEQDGTDDYMSYGSELGMEGTPLT